MKKQHYNVDFSMLRIFLATAQAGNMSLAAKGLDLTQPAVSNAIQKLETRFGAKLFDRTERPIQLTPAGRVLQKRVESILNDLDYLTKEVQESTKEPQINLRLGFSDSVGGTVVPEMLHLLVPRVSSLSAYTASSPRIVQKLLKNEIDIAVSTLSLAEEGSVNSIFLLNERFVIATPKKYEGKIHSLADLARVEAELPVIRFNDESLDSIQVERVLRSCNAKGEKRIEADTNHSVLSLVQHGTGWTVMPPLGIWMARSQASNVAFHDIITTTRSFYIQYRSPVYKVFAEAITKEAGKILKESVLPEMSRDFPLLARCVHVEPGWNRFKPTL